MATRKNMHNDSIIDGVINQVSKLTEVGRQTAADWVESVSPDAASFIRPESKPRSTKRTIKVTGPKSTTAKTATAKKSTAKKTATARKASTRSAQKSATR